MGLYSVKMMEMLNSTIFDCLIYKGYGQVSCSNLWSISDPFLVHFWSVSGPFLIYFAR